MAQYDVYPSSKGTGYLLDVQTDMLDGISTRVVVPLVPERSAPRPTNPSLNPVFEVEGKRCVMIAPTLAAVSAKALRHPVANLAARADEVTRALDMLFHGF